MKILIVHNYYRSDSPSGENQVVANELAMLESRGHQVALFARHSDDLARMGIRGAIIGALGTPWNPRAAALLRVEAARFVPDIVHVHNSFPMLSPAIFSTLSDIAPRVLTLHNYRLFCAAGIPMRENRVCTLCLDKRSAIPALRHGCYRGSRLATAPLATNIELHRRYGTWQREVDAFIALTAFQRAIMVDAGLPGDKVHVKPNFTSKTTPPLPWDERGYHALYVGRLSPEKGVSTLIEAWRQWGPNAPMLKIAGGGPLEQELRASAEGLPIQFLGQLDGQAAQAEIATARLMLLPSEWFEGFPMVLVEAMSHGTPVAVSNIGSLPEIVTARRTGLVFEPGNSPSLVANVRRYWQDSASLAALGNAARLEFEARYTEKPNHDSLMEIYGHAIARFRGA